MKTAEKKHATEGIIQADSAYTLRELSRRAGLGHTAIRLARTKGLKLRRLGRKIFVLGRDWMTFLENLDSEETEMEINKKTAQKSEYLNG